MFQPKGTGSVMKKMEIEKLIDNEKSNSNLREFILPNGKVGNVHKGSKGFGIHSVHEDYAIILVDDFMYKITETSKDMLDHLTWLVGQEKHKEETSKLKDYPMIRTTDSYGILCTCGHNSKNHTNTRKSNEQEECHVCECPKFKKVILTFKTN